MWVLLAPILILCLALWSIIGFLFWIPLLVRTVAVFSAGILYATLTREDPAVYGRQLQTAVTFYADGFRRTVMALSVRADANGAAPKGPPFRVARFLVEIAWAGVFWVAFLILLERLELVPPTLRPALHGWLGRLGV